MFETSFVLFLKALLYNIVLPLVPGILFLWIFFGKKFEWIVLYILWWFVGVWVVAFSLFNLQFIHFGLGIGEYMIILWILIVVFVGKLLYKKESFHHYAPVLKIKNIFPQIKKSFFLLSQIEKIFTIVCGGMGIILLILTFVRVTNFPTYGDDSFGNRNGPAYNIYQDGWVKIFWKENEILGRWRLWYPIYIGIYKANVSSFIGSFDDIYINLRQWLVFLGMVLFIFTITFTKTKNIFYSLLPIGLVVSLPLIFFHSADWYMELPCAVYSLITIWAFWKFLEEKDYDYMSLALLLGFVLSHIKNDWLLWYFAGILISFVVILILAKQLLPMIVGFANKKVALRSSLFYGIFFFVPFLFVKRYYHLWFNQAVTTSWGLGISSTVHSEIFSVFKPIFFTMDNYNVILIVVLLLWVFGYYYKKRDLNDLFLVLTPFIIFLIFVLVFLLTESYIVAMNQTTINRVFTMAFLVLLAFTWLFFYKKWND